jgi:hypothetical protein
MQRSRLGCLGICGPFPSFCKEKQACGLLARLEDDTRASCFSRHMTCAQFCRVWKGKRWVRPGGDRGELCESSTSVATGCAAGVRLYKSCDSVLALPHADEMNPTNPSGAKVWRTRGGSEPKEPFSGQSYGACADGMNPTNPISENRDEVEGCQGARPLERTLQERGGINPRPRARAMHVHNNGKMPLTPTTATCAPRGFRQQRTRIR